MATIDEIILGTNRALERCDTRSRVTGKRSWSVAIAALLGVKAGLIMAGVDGERVLRDTPPGTSPSDAPFARIDQ